MALHSQKETLLVQEIQKLQVALDRKAYTRGSEVFEKLYNYVSNVHVQVGRCGVHACEGTMDTSMAL